MTYHNDQRIIKGIQTGDEAVIKAFYKKNLIYIRGYILKNRGSEADVEDVFQDALIWMYQKFRSECLRKDVSIHTYFYGICKNMWRNRLRQKTRLILDEIHFKNLELDENYIIDKISLNEKEQLYRKCFLKLSRSNRELLNLFFEGKSMKEIAKIMGYSEGYTRKKKFQSKKALLEIIENNQVYQELRTA
ncbi:sigma-70 family RNA polymerase sigma factor [Aquimarina sp. 2201CG5-10]|uniref:RNA polymerase sigma factor n=1 Tax=Aquimarina callyspongiae TaxID=3098150 RepID=UPI002AB55087|nr:sigma-70 family RNA polymerase sigma factor [Aquimarina sp. 2201CG5-10]MDY8135204.1 sigma-70 family RNA polymerase sigma factor [Aquimarina sp. 2201CG5-10]